MLLSGQTPRLPNMLPHELLKVFTRESPTEVMGEEVMGHHGPSDPQTSSEQVGVMVPVPTELGAPLSTDSPLRVPWDQKPFLRTAGKHVLFTSGSQSQTWSSPNSVRWEPILGPPNQNACCENGGQNRRPHSCRSRVPL